MNALLKSVTTAWDGMSSWLTQGGNLLLSAQVLAAAVTAIATIMLWWVTKILAKETRSLAALSKPFVTMTLEPNQWTLMYFDQVVENSGDAAAFDIEISISPESPTKWTDEHKNAIWKEINILRPGQAVKADMGSYIDLEDKKINIQISWADRPLGKKREVLKYAIDMAHFKEKGRLGANTPLHQIANEVEKIRKDWRSVATGQRRLDVYTHNSSDRETERAEQEELLERQRRRIAEKEEK